MLTVKMLPAKGIYTLILFLPKEIHLKIGKLGTQRFPRGYYTYTGSALGIGSSSLRQRLLRHLKKKKQKFWHIDFLLSHQNVHLTGLVAAEIDGRVECQMNLYIKIKERAEIPVPHFGASDCRRDCGSHLLYFGREDITKRIATLYNEKFGINPITVDFFESLSKGQNPLSSRREQRVDDTLSVTVKPATLHDLKALHKIERECFTIEAFTKQQMTRLLENPNTISLVARMNNDIAGFIIGSIENLDNTKAGHVYTLDVAINHRRKGVGLRLLQGLEHIFAKEGVKICLLEVRLDNMAARELYQKQGYTEVAPLKDYYHRGIHGIHLEKKLAK